jgi:hypothetical protein
LPFQLVLVTIQPLMFYRFRSLSFSTAFGIGLLLCLTTIQVGDWKTHHVIQSDVSGYYSFLPAVFIYHDLSFSFEKELPPALKAAIWKVHTEDGRPLQKYTMGVSFLYAPFFFSAHFLAPAFNYPQNGYAIPYQLAIALSSVFYLLLALLFLRQVLLRFFTERITTLTLVSLVLATNLFYYSTSEGGMSHVYSFFLFAGFLACFMHWNTAPKGKYSVLLGILAGMIVLVRPTNGLLFLIPILYNTSTLSTFKRRLSWLWSQRMSLGVVLLCATAVCFPQLLYWKYATGQWVYFSYLNEQFFFSRPHIIDGLFSYRNGWLTYTPIMCFGLVGLFFLKDLLRPFLLPIGLFVLLNVYVAYSWWCWWYGGSFGSRPMIESYALLALPMGAFYEKVLSSSRKIRLVFLGIVTYLTWLNLFQTAQKRRGIIHYDGMTRALYWTVFNDLYHSRDFWNQLQQPDYESALKGEREKLHYAIIDSSTYAFLGFNTYTAKTSNKNAASPPFSFALSGGEPFSPNIRVPATLLSNNTFKMKIRASVMVLETQPKSSDLHLIVRYVRSDSSIVFERSRRFSPNKDLSSVWQSLTLDVVVPKQLSPDDQAIIVVHNKRAEEILIDNLKVDLLYGTMY